MGFNQYARKLKKLRVDHKKDIGKAPHKPILLLAVTDLIDNGQIKENRIPITPELVATFKELWSLLVQTPHKLNFALPFYHLKSDKFWHLVTYPGAEIALTASRSIKSLSSLKMTVAYASVDDELFYMLKNEPERRNDVRRLLLDTYFPATQQHYFDVKGKVNTYLSQIEYEMAAEESETYRKKVDPQDEEDVFVRSSIFKHKIPQIYNFTCAVSGFRLETTNDATLVDACHIAPWSEYHDDTITNGITLSPNLHRAFDKGLFTIDEEYRFRIYEHFTESFSPFNLHQFEGKEIHLPKNKSYWPKPENFSLKLRSIKS